jgi:DNA-binding MarR family transcriptional regulator
LVDAQPKSRTTAHTVGASMPETSDNCFALRQAARFITQRYERTLTPYGVTPGQFSLLMMLNEAPGLTTDTISKSMVLERSATERLLKVLAAKGLIVFEVAPERRRRRSVFLTQEGRNKFEQALQGWETAQSAFISHFGDERARKLRKMLFAMTRNESKDGLFRLFFERQSLTGDSD